MEFFTNLLVPGGGATGGAKDPAGIGVQSGISSQKNMNI